MSAEATTPLPLDPALLARFRQQAAALIAHERGLTPACRIKLADVARSMGLAETQMEEAIRTLTAEPEAPPNPQAERFRRRLRKRPGRDVAGDHRPRDGNEDHRRRQPQVCLERQARRMTCWPKLPPSSA